MTTTTEVASNRTFLALTYFELAFLVSELAREDALIRQYLPLPGSSGVGKPVLEAGRMLLSERLSAFSDGDTSYSSALEVVVETLSHATASVVLSLGSIEPLVVGAFVRAGVTVEMAILPEGQVLLGALDATNLSETILGPYAVEHGKISMTVLALRADGESFWLSNLDGGVTGANGDSFNLAANGPDWQVAVEQIVGNVSEFVSR